MSSVEIELLVSSPCQRSPSLLSPFLSLDHARSHSGWDRDHPLQLFPSGFETSSSRFSQGTSARGQPGRSSLLPSPPSLLGLPLPSHTILYILDFLTEATSTSYILPAAPRGHVRRSHSGTQGLPPPAQRHPRPSRPLGPSSIHQALTRFDQHLRSYPSSRSISLSRLLVFYSAGP